MAVRIAVADEQAPVREGLRSALSRDPRFLLLGVARDGFELVDLFRWMRADLAVTGVSMPGQSVFDTLRLLRRIDPKMCLVAFGPRDEPVVADRCVLAGADVYLSKRLPVGEILEHLEECAQEKRESPSVWERSDSDTRGLSLRELEVLQLMGRGLGHQEIASALHVSSKTVATHWSHLQEKLDLRSQWDAIACCVRTQPPAMTRTRVSDRSA